MGCCGNRRKQTDRFADQKWEYINLKDFTGGVGPGFAYAYLWFSLILSVAVYAIDSFTAVQLLAFNRWSSAIQPFIPLNISKWIFCGCIIASFVNLGYEAVRATRVMKRGNVAECYMDSLAARWESIRVGGGQGYRRFLVFAALTKGKKGADYIALFTYFSFQAWIRVLLCSAPRQVVNAFTLKSVYEAKLVAANSHNIGESFVGFFDKIKILAEDDYRQAAILSGMAFTFVIWVFSVLYLLLAVCFYVFFLFHWIPRADGGLTGYCERKVNKALLKIVTKRVNKAMAKRDAKAAKMMDGEKPLYLDRAATLPDVGGPFTDDKLPQMPALARVETGNSYSTRAPSPGSIEMSPMGYGLNRTGTGTSASTYAPNASLINGAADMGYGRNSPAPTVPSLDLNNMPPQRPGTAQSQRPPPYGGPMNGNYPPPRGYGMNGPMDRPGSARPDMRNGPPRPYRGDDMYKGPQGPPGAYPGSAGPEQAPGHAEAHYLGAPSLPNIDLGTDANSAHNDNAAIARQPTIPDLGGTSSPPPRTATANSQRGPGPGGFEQPAYGQALSKSPEPVGDYFPPYGGPGNGATRAPAHAHYQPYNQHGYAAAAATGNPYDCDDLASRTGTPIVGGASTPTMSEHWAPTRNLSNPGQSRTPQPVAGSGPGHLGFQPPSRTGTGQERSPPPQSRGPPGYGSGRRRLPGQPVYDEEAQRPW